MSPVVAARNQQNAWYAWQTRVVWASIWDTGISCYGGRPLDLLERDLTGLTSPAVVTFARADAGALPRRSDDLYRRRVGLSYLLPFGGRPDGAVLPAGTAEAAGPNRSRVSIPIEINSREADVVQALAGTGIWQKAFRISVEDSPENRPSPSYAEGQDGGKDVPAGGDAG